MNNIKFNYQRIISDDCVPIATEKVSYFPLLVDYSSTYIYNQYDIISPEEKVVQLGDPYNYIEDISNDNVVVTDKETALGVPLFYQYQLKFDAVNIQNLKVYGTNNRLISPNIEYGDIYFGDTRIKFILTNNEAMYIDTLDDKSELGVSFNSLIYKYLSDSIGETEEDLPYKNYDMCLGNGKIDYNSGLLPSEGQLEIYFMAKVCDRNINTEVLYFKGGGVKVNFVYDGTYNLDFIVGTSQGTFSIDQGKWYKLYVTWEKNGENSEIKVRVLGESSEEDHTYTCAETFINDFVSADFYLRSNKNYLYNMGIFDHTTSDNWTDPIYLNRYATAIKWNATPLGAEPYRIRILLPDNQEYTVIYDAMDEDGNIILNKKETVNAKFIYKGYSPIEVNDWYYDNGKIYLTEALFDVAEGAELWVTPIVEQQVKVFLDSQNKINVVNGIFRADNYSVPSGVLDYYYVPEYEEMPVMADNQVSEPILCWKVIREKAKVVGPYKLQINKFLFTDGLYPEYLVPNTFEKHKHAESIPTPPLSPSGVIEETVDVSINYTNNRGVNIYINNELISNSEIINYSITGVIELSRRLKSDDNIEVTYLKRADSYIAQYPNLSKDVVEGSGYRLYLRPSFPNYAVNWSDDPTERLIYRVMNNGIPVGDYYSCLTNEVIDHDVEPSGIFVEPSGLFDETYIKLADIAMISAVEYSDVRRLGGGIKEDGELGGVDERLAKFPLSPGYMDIGSVNGEQVPNSIVFYKIPKALKEQLDTKFDTPEKAMSYIKKEIEKHLAAGVFYCVVDENDVPYEEPFSETLKDVIE